MLDTLTPDIQDQLTQIGFDDEEITIITPESPLAQAVMKKRAGDSFAFRSSVSPRILTVI